MTLAIGTGNGMFIDARDPALLIRNRSLPRAFAFGHDADDRRGGPTFSQPLPCAGGLAQPVLQPWCCKVQKGAEFQRQYRLTAVDQMHGEGLGLVRG